MFIVTNNVTN